MSEADEYGPGGKYESGPDTEYDRQHGITRVAALYVETNGAYFNLPDVEPWDEERDARLYDGPWPVVAHPPCNRWVSYGDLSKRGQDRGCFAAALQSVRKYGGVLEQPALSRAWYEFALPMPSFGGWVSTFSDEGYTSVVDQWHYGFPTRKLTWLYYVGDDPPELIWRRADAGRGCETLWSTERSKTPPAFRDVLLEMARSASPVPAEQSQGKP